MKALLSFVTLFLTLNAFAQGGGGGGNGGAGSGTRGGGFALVCYRDLEVWKKVISNAVARLPGTDVDLHLSKEALLWPPVTVDYYEMLRANHLQVADVATWGTPIAPQDFTTVAERIHKRVDETHYQPMKFDYERFYYLFLRTRTQPSEWDYTLHDVPRVIDARFKELPDNRCLYVQVAYFDDVKRKVQVNLPLLSLMNDENRDALWVHEDATHYYREGRRQCLTMTRTLRRWVGGNTRLWSDAITDAWCKLPETGTTDYAREFVAHEISRGHHPDPNAWQNKFRDQANRISLAVAFGESFSSLTHKDPYGRLESGYWFTTELVRVLSGQHLTPIEANWYFGSPHVLRLMGLELPFPLLPANR